MYIPIEKTFELPHGTLVFNTSILSKVQVISNPEFPNQYQVTIKEPSIDVNVNGPVANFGKPNKSFIVQSNGDHTGEYTNFTAHKGINLGHFKVQRVKGQWHGRLIAYPNEGSDPDIFSFYQFNIKEGEEVDL